MTTSSPRYLLILGASILMTAALTWHIARADLRQFTAEDTLQPVAALLEDNHKLVASLQQAEGVDTEGALLPAYLALIRKDGVPKHSELKQAIDRWMNNNTAIVTLLDRYTAHNGSASFRVAATQYSEYATTIRDRWQSVFEIFMAGGNLPAASAPPPVDFSASVRSELQ